jgi:hypothetical protein
MGLLRIKKQFDDLVICVSLGQQHTVIVIPIEKLENIEKYTNNCQPKIGLTYDLPNLN